MAAIEKIWPQLGLNGDAVAASVYYTRLLDHFNAASELALPTSATETLGDTLDLLAEMRGLAGGTTLAQMTRRDLVDGLRRAPRPWQRFDETSVLNAMCLTLSLRLTLAIVHTKEPTHGVRALEWADTSTVQNLMNEAFPTAQPVQGEVDSLTTLAHLETYHDFEICFTHNLAEHLDLDLNTGGRPLVVVYMHKIFLWNELRCGHAQSLLPDGLVKETLDTLHLLLPFNDDRAKKILEQRNMLDFDALGWCDRPATTERDLAKYRYWGEKLARLSAIVAAGPTGWRALMLGRDGPGSDVREVLNFWIAVVILTVLTVGFGTASVVLGVLQYNLGRLQYDLSLAQACATMNSSQLPGFC